MKIAWHDGHRFCISHPGGCARFDGRLTGYLFINERKGGHMGVGDIQTERKKRDMTEKVNRQRQVQTDREADRQIYK